MGALTGNAVKDTYLDLVQLGKSGAGLPSHAGKEAALYDGAGYQILGRTAVRHWLDPHPDAIAGTWEFSTYGDATQGELETAGWTFSNCTGVVSNGVFWLTATDNAIAKAYTTVSLGGDFDYLAAFISDVGYAAVQVSTESYGGFGVADSVNDKAYFGVTVDGVKVNRHNAGSWAALGGVSSTIIPYDTPLCVRVSRVSTTVRIGGAGIGQIRMIVDQAAYANDGFQSAATATDSNTMTNIFITCAADAAVNGGKIGCLFIRRFQ
jgi:hypothetical protein